MAAATFSAKDLAQECGTDGRTIRKFLRSYLPPEDQPGQGGRYAFTKGEVTKIKKAFSSSTKTTDTDTDKAPAKKKSKKGKGKVKELDFLPEDDERDPDEDVLDFDAIDDPSLDDLDDEEGFEVDDLED